jgi:PAS domain S-box-containing protein
VLKRGGVVSWSPEMFQICGFDPEQGPPSYRQIIEQMPPPDGAEVDQNVQAALVMGKRLAGMCRFIRPDGQVRHLEYLGHPVPAESGDVEFVGIIRDVTDRARLAAQPGRVKYARLLPQHYHSYPPDYRRQWFPVLERHPDTSVAAQPGYIWVQTPWRLHAMWAEHFEIEERE